MIGWCIFAWTVLGVLTAMAGLQESKADGTWKTRPFAGTRLAINFLITVALGPVGAFLWLAERD